MNEPYIPLGWPTEVELSSVAAGIDVGWPFTLITKELPRRGIREMFGTWRYRVGAPAADPYRWIPDQAMERLSVKALDKMFPDREWVCPLQILVVGIANVRKAAIYTSKYDQENRVFEAKFTVGEDGGRSGLRQMLIQFANGVGVGP